MDYIFIEKKDSYAFETPANPSIGSFIWADAIAAFFGIDRPAGCRLGAGPAMKSSRFLSMV